MKLHLRIFLTFMLGVTGLLIAVALSLYSHQKSELIIGLEEKTRVTEEFVIRVTDNQKQKLTTSIRTITEDWWLQQAIGRNNMSEIANTLNDHRIRALAEEAVFISADGTVIGSNARVSPELSKAWEQAVRGGALTSFQVLQVGGEYLQVALAEIKAPQFVGWLCMTHRLGEVRKAVTESPGQKQMGILVYDRSTEPNYILLSRNIRSDEQQQLLVTAPPEAHFESRHISINGREIVAQSETVEYAPHIRIIVFAFVDEALVTLNAFWHRMAALFAAFALISLCVTYVTAKNITRPLQLLLATVRKLESGDFSTDINIRRTDEIGDLAIAFRQMQNAVSERELKIKDSMQQLEYQAAHDVLTGLGNRRTLATQLEFSNIAAIDEGKNYCVCIMDLDRFKVVNDTSGHAAGDALLIQVANLIRETVYSTDTVVRLGGDEFAILMHDCEAEIAIRVCEDIRKNIEQMVFQWEGSSHRIGTSIGILSVSKTVNSTSEILQRADAACFTAKELGRNQIYHVADSAPPVDKKRKELHWVQRLSTAIDQDQFLLFSQPVVPLQVDAAEEDERLEILVRLRNFETKKLVPPGAFIPSAERYGLNAKIDKWVISQLVKITAIYDSVFSENRSYWVNLSACSLGDEEFIDFLEAKIRDSNLPAGRLNFEITETAFIRNTSEASAVMHRLKQFGCQFALDDFGAGLSSFGYLKSLPVDCLKIDGLFVRNILESRIDRMFVKSIIDIAREMNIRTVAESVENQAILDEVTALGADYGQGFALGRPVELTPNMAKRNEVPDNVVAIR